MMSNIAVTGVGAVIGHGVVKSIRHSGALRDSRIIGIDNNPDSSGFMQCDGHYVCERVSSPDYVDELLEVCMNEAVDVFIPLIEEEFLLVHDNMARFEKIGTHVIMQPRRILETFMDKYSTAVALRNAGIATPDTLLFTPENIGPVLDMVERHGFPLFAKPRRGRSSKGQVLIGSEQQLIMYMDMLKGQPYVIQEFLDDGDHEYTCGVFMTPDMNEPYSIALKRRLLNGMTISAEVVFDESLARMCNDVARSFPFDGSFNVQCRMKDGVPHVFEINPRYSSTSYIRAMCGFNDVEMGIHYALGHHVGRMPKVEKCKVIRYWEERCVESRLEAT